jgi:predicted RNA-binding protein associated with RNAse of E/G family
LVKKSYRLNYFHAHDKHFEIGIIVDVYLEIGQKLKIV